jgi:hypothetical protein
MLLNRRGRRLRGKLEIRFHAPGVFEEAVPRVPLWVTIGRVYFSPGASQAGAVSLSLGGGGVLPLGAACLRLPCPFSLGFAKAATASFSSRKAGRGLSPSQHFASGLGVSGPAFASLSRNSKPLSRPQGKFICPQTCLPCAGEHVRISRWLWRLPQTCLFCQSPWSHRP